MRNIATEGWIIVAKMRNIPIEGWIIVAKVRNIAIKGWIIVAKLRNIATKRWILVAKLMIIAIEGLNIAFWRRGIATGGGSIAASRGSTKIEGWPWVTLWKSVERLRIAF